MSHQPDPTTAAPPPPALFMSCSECRAPMRDKYYALNDRPICAKCRPAYARKIARTDGPGAIWRVGFQGALIAVLGGAVLFGVSSVFPAARIFPLIPIGYLVGKRMMSTLEGYSSRRYQYLAVALTYACFLAGMYLPTIKERRETAARRAEVQAKMQGTVATQDAALREELADLTARSNADAAAADSVEPQPAPPVVPAPKEEPTIGPGLAFVFLLLFPFFAMLQFGTAFSAVGVAALGYALYQAWKQTDGQGTHLELSGPFRVGAGPISAR